AFHDVAAGPRNARAQRERDSAKPQAKRVALTTARRVSILWHPRPLFLKAARYRACASRTAVTGPGRRVDRRGVLGYDHSAAVSAKNKFTISFHLRPVRLKRRLAVGITRCEGDTTPG